jgi:hypothetical protein
MVNNATNFNKTNISPELAENKTTKKETMTYYVRNPGPGVQVFWLRKLESPGKTTQDYMR